MKNERKLYEYITKSEKISKLSFEKKISVAFLSSFTIKGIEEIIKVKCSENNLESKIYLAGYNQYQQEILNDKSKLYISKPNIIFIILDVRHILGDFFFDPYHFSQNERKQAIENKIEEIKKLLLKLLKNSESKIVFSNLNIPTYSPYGIYEGKEEYGIRQMIY